MPVTLIDFSSPDILEGVVRSVTRDGVTLRFVSPARVVRFAQGGVAGQGVVNGAQNQHDETNQNPMLLEFDRLQRRVRIRVGLEDVDLSVEEVVAPMRAHDAAGQLVGVERRALGRGPLPPSEALEVVAGGDVIQRVEIEFSGLLRELLGDVELEADVSAVRPVDIAGPVVRVTNPTVGQSLTDSAVQVRGWIEEQGEVVSLAINDAPVAVRRSSASTWEFNSTIVLRTDEDAIEVVARDAAGNVGVARVDIDLRVAAVAVAMDVRFTQTGLLSGTAMPDRRVARKTGLLRVVPQLRTLDGRPATAESATLRLEGAGTTVWIAGHRRPGQDGRFSSPGGPHQDGAPIYFFLDGALFRPGIPYRLVLRLGGRVHVALEQEIATDWSFTAIRGVTMLVVPQHRPLAPALDVALLQTMTEMARMYPVPDGVANLDGDEPGGVRFAVLPPTSYDAHTDPADAGWTHHGEISYEQGFLMVDHAVVVDTGPDGQWATEDDVTAFWAGEFLPLNFMASEDQNRDGVLSAEDRARTVGGASAASVRRNANWNAFVREQAESARLHWNEARRYAPSRRARRAVAIVTRDGAAGQNRTGWAGNAGGGETSFWADVDTGLGAFLPHEVGHTYGIVSHPDDDLASEDARAAACRISGEVVNLMSRAIVASPRRLMCSDVGVGSDHFLATTEYEMIFDLIAARGGD